MSKDDLEVQRYSVLGQIWAHHNQTQLQWPVVAIGVILVGLGTLVSSSSGLDMLTSVSDQFGDKRHLIFGMFFLLAGIITLLMVRTMRRARRIMAYIEREMDILDDSLGYKGERCFSGLNHPRAASGRTEFSGPLLLALALVLTGTLIVIFGFWLIAGRLYGSFAASPIVALSIWQGISVFRTYRKRPPPIIQRSSQAAEMGKA